jgi:hypothetical protein
MSTLNGGPGNIVTNGLVLYLDAANYQSYVSGSTTWRDLSSSNLSGSLINGPTYNSGNAGSIVFDGVDDYVNCGSGISTTTTITVNAWVKLSINNNYQHIVDSSGNTWHLAVLNNGRAYFWDGNVYHTAGGILSTNTWYMVTGVKTLITNDIYINGTINNSLNSTSSINTNTVNLSRWQGNLDNPISRYLNGNIATTQIYNRALTASEVLQNYNATKGRFGL